jgi:hypothetical protein
MSQLTAVDVRRSGGMVQLGADRSSAERFWAMVLQFAAADRAEAVLFRPALGDSCLACVVEGETYPMVPPEDAFRRLYFRVGRDLLAGSRLRGLLWWWRARWLGREPQGEITLKSEGRSIRWSGTYRVEGACESLVIQRLH